MFVKICKGQVCGIVPFEDTAGQQGTVSFFKIPKDVESPIAVVIYDNIGLIGGYRGADVFVEPVAHDHGTAQRFFGKC